MMPHYLSKNYSGKNNPENHLIRQILIQTISWQSWRAASMNPESFWIE